MNVNGGSSLTCTFTMHDDSSYTATNKVQRGFSEPPPRTAPSGEEGVSWRPPPHPNFAGETVGRASVADVWKGLAQEMATAAERSNLPGVRAWTSEARAGASRDGASGARSRGRP